LDSGSQNYTAKDYSAALVDPNAGDFFHNPSNPTTVLNRAAFVDTPDFGFSSAPLIFPNVRNPGSFFRDATLLKKFPFSSEGSRYFEIRLEAQNIFNHPNFNNIDNI
jgi:hypothetical protein